MANEAILMWETEVAIPINVLDANAIPKGTGLALADGFVGAASSGDNDIFGGITKTEKIANDGKTKVAVYFGGIFKMVVGNDAATIGLTAVYDDAANTVKNAQADADLADGLAIGKFLETGTTGETVLVFVGKI